MNVTDDRKFSSFSRDEWQKEHEDSCWRFDWEKNSEFLMNVLRYKSRSKLVDIFIIFCQYASTKSYDLPILFYNNELF